MVEFFVNALRIVLIWIDKLIAEIIGMAYNLFITIADTNIFNEEVLKLFSQRIYAILAIFMLFKMGFSLINYIVNPDDFTDKSKGAGKLVINILIVLVLIVSVPTIFSIAYDLQGKILKTNVIPQLILGVGSELDSEDDDKKPGDEMAYIVYTGFITPNSNYPSMGDKCKELYTAEEPPTECINFLKEQSSATEAQNLELAVKNKDVQLLLDGDILNVNTNGVYFFSVLFIISSICGVIVAWVLLMFSIDIAIRVVKLGFLQLISPIPIISYIDPKSSKDGMFKKWMTESISTYADLFIRLLAISFAIFIIQIIASSEITRTSDPTEVISFTTHPLVKVLLLIGTLLFAKQLPKLIEDLTGKKMSGNFTLNPMNKLGATPLIGGGLAAGMSLGKNTALGAGSAAWAKLRKGDPKEAFRKRMDAGKTEARARFGASGLMGADKPFSGDTAGKVLSKERLEEKTKARQAEVGLIEQQKLWDAGKASERNAPKLNTETDFKKAGFKNDKFIKSKLAIKSAENRVKEAKISHTSASNKYQAMVNRLHSMDEAANPTAYKEYERRVEEYRNGDYKEAVEQLEGFEKSLSALEKNHNDYIAPQCKDDATLDKARKVAKGPRPGTFESE